MAKTPRKPNLAKDIGRTESRVSKLERVVNGLRASSGGGGVPSGPAGGVLTGTYPNPNLANSVIVNNHINALAAIDQSKISGLVTALSGKQPLNSNLTSIAALSTTTYGRAFLTLADSTAGRSYLGLVIGTNVQAYNSNLASISLLSTTSYGRNFLTMADGTAARSHLGLGNAAVMNVPAAGDASSTEVVKGDDSRLTNSRTPTAHTHPHTEITDFDAGVRENSPDELDEMGNDLSFGGYKGINLADGEADSDAANLGQVLDEVETAKAGFTFRPQVKFATVEELPAYVGSGTNVLEASANGTLHDALGQEGESFPYEATFYPPGVFAFTSIAQDESGNFWATGSQWTAETQYRLVKFNSAGVILAVYGSTGSGNGQFSDPRGVAVRGSNVYVLDAFNNRVQRFNLSGVYQSQFGSFGSGNGQFMWPLGITTDSSGNVYVTDTYNYRVQKFNSSGVYQSQFGSGGTSNGQFSLPQGITTDSSGNIYVVDTGNARIQKFNSSGVYQSKFGTTGTSNGEFNNPTGLALDASGNIYVLDTHNYRIQKFNSSGVYQSKFGSLGTGTGQFRYPNGITVDASGKIYVAEAFNSRIQKFGYIAASPINLNDDVLVKDQGAGTHPDNGLYSITALGSGSAKWKLTRREDADTDIESPSGLMVNAKWLGTKTPGGTYYITTPDPITIGTTPVSWEPYLPGGYPTPHAESHGPDGEDPLPATPGAIVYRSTNQSIPATTSTTIAFDSERSNVGCWSSANPTRLTAPETGIYICTFSARLSASTNGRRLAFIQLNGTTTRVTEADFNPAADTMSVSGLWRMSAGDYVEARLYLGVALSALANVCHFSIQKLSV